MQGNELVDQTNSTESTRLMPNPFDNSTENTDKFDQSANNEVNKISKTPSIPLKTLSFGSYGLLISGQMVLNGKLMAALGNEVAGASALILPYQSVLLGLSMGPVLASGIELGKLIGKKEYQEAGHVARCSWLLTTSLGALVACLSIGSSFVLPYLFEEHTAEAAELYFLGAAAGNIFLLLMNMNAQIAFNEEDFVLPPLAALSYLISAGIVSYLLAFPGNLGPLGLGLGGTIGAFLTNQIMIHTLYAKSNYKKYNLFQLSYIPEFRKKLKNLFLTGIPFSIQRLTEWISMMLMVTIIGYESNTALKAMGPSTQHLGLFGAALQGMGIAAGMLVASNNGAFKKALEQNEHFEIVKKWHTQNVRSIFQSNVVAASLSAALVAACYFGRSYLVEPFLPKMADASLRELSKDLLAVNLLGAVPTDGIRITSTGALRGWKSELYFPTVVSAISMVGIGIALGWGCGKLFGNETNNFLNPAMWMSYLRDLTILLAAVIIAARCAKKLSQNKEKMTVYVSNNHAALFSKYKTIQIDPNNERKEENIESQMRNIN